MHCLLNMNRTQNQNVFPTFQVWNCCAFQKHAKTEVQKPPSQLRFSLPSIIITITSNEPWNTETHTTDRNPPITNHNSWPFEPVKVNFCFQRGPLRWLTATKNASVSWLLNFKICVFMKSAVICKPLWPLLQTEMRICLPFNSYTSTSKRLTLLYTRRLQKVPRSSQAEHPRMAHYREFSTRVMVGQWWEYSPSTNVARVQIPTSLPYVGWVCCWFSSLFREVFLRVLRFPISLKTNTCKFQFDLERHWFCYLCVLCPRRIKIRQHAMVPLPSRRMQRSIDLKMSL